MKSSMHVYMRIDDFIHDSLCTEKVAIYSEACKLADFEVKTDCENAKHGAICGINKF